MESGFAGRRVPLPSRRTAAEIAAGLVVAIALMGARDGRDPETPAVGTKHPVSRMSNPAKDDAVSLGHHEVKVKPITTNRRRKQYRDSERERHNHRRYARPSPPPHPDPTPAPVEAPPETVIYSEPVPPPASTEAPPPTSPGAEFGM
jgi:hypothetical protein